MNTVLTASNSEILRLLGSRACARLGVARQVVASGRDALETARRERPRVAILDVTMPDLNGYDVCRQIKGDPKLASCRVMLVVSGILDRPTLDHLAECGCDDVLVMPAIGEEFFTHVANLLGVPRRRSRRVAVELMARLDGGTNVWTGKVDNLSLTGAKVRLDESLSGVDQVRVRLVPPREEKPTVVDARVVWVREEGRAVGLEFRNVSSEANIELENLVLWEVVKEDDLLRVYLEGDFTEMTDFSTLGRRLSGPVDFDAAGIRYINSGGAHRWISFLRTLTKVQGYTFSRCSVAFTTQASLVSSFIGQGRVVSFMAPYHCDTCDRDETRLLQTAAVVSEGPSRVAPRFRCPQCQGYLAFDDLPDRYFAFLAWTEDNAPRQPPGR